MSEQLPLVTPPQATTFADLALCEVLLNAVTKIGFERPTEVQQQAIPSILERKDMLVSAETGSGKTAAFLLPMLQNILSHTSTLFGTRALILSPTRELAQQTYAQCCEFAAATNIKTALITGGEDFKRQQSAVRRNVAVIVATPGRLVELINQQLVDFTQLDMLILDEADRMLDMGFSEAVLRIANYCQEQRQTLLFSATLTHYGVLKMADQLLNNHYKTLALNSLHQGHQNISQEFMVADDVEHKQKILAWLLLNESYDKALIFTNTRLRANSLQDPLRAQGLRVGVLHGEMDQRDRNRMMQLFREGVVNIIISTDLAARGLDVKGINLVINFEVPRTGINYIHRIGRTGRADELGLAILLVRSSEWNLMAGIQRFLHQKFTQRIVKEVGGSYKGPKKLKTSGKAVGSKTKEEPKKLKAKKVKVRLRDKKNIGKRRQPNQSPDTERNVE